MSAKSKSKGKSKTRASGFEDGFADPPVTPMEYAAERKIYDPRIEECIQRYMSRRRLTNERRTLFTKYLALGGVDTDQRQFTGTAKHVKDMKEDDEYDADNFREVTANEGLSRDWEEMGKYYNPHYPEHWDVDFAGVVAGFLGDWLPRTWGLSVHDNKLAADTILNFLRYIQHHDVCPEYADNLFQARKICELSCTEIPRVGEVSRAMPGDFNLACQVLFCSARNASSVSLGSTDSKNLPNDMATWDVETNCWDTGISAPKDFDAERIFKATISVHEPGLISRVLQHTCDPIRVVNTYEDAFDVKDIIPPSDSITDIYNGIKSKAGKTRTIKPVGRAVLIPSIIEDGWDNHPTMAEGRSDEGKPVSLYLEDTILANLKEGMKLRLTISQLNIMGGGNSSSGGGDGIRFIRAWSEVLPSFHTFLPQSLMQHYKRPRLSDRPPPSVDDPDAEDRAFLEEAEAETKEAEKAERRADSELDRQMKEQEQAEALLKVMERVKVDE
ncbi:hypothetical protein DHEL01_v202897 [Diaporthe helianthi]|uniref:Argonaute siRNA chaperone complex subunit Arb1 n=1 Tax=Diaporthe helianthi TaxID=158607 RepID=A0A2P5I891_DIAHE|nr:hypothetical protein DHEL01_v202897 [Diaporthe helianthi]